ncbi:RHS repeat-associated core domain-containing protein [Mangrovitalea sediminis]|uniref:RHS repeat-associated core domain-containing protein n=1 Tax=Mangrovitalea sediminis TaxID=1982043 RepID=UPI000BE548C1|nr:RHS repeat-associated core domain-containing protein [Mangrovitalea sediminis]
MLLGAVELEDPFNGRYGLVDIATFDWQVGRDARNLAHYIPINHDYSDARQLVRWLEQMAPRDAYPSCWYDCLIKSGQWRPGDGVDSLDHDSLIQRVAEAVVAGKLVLYRENAAARPTLPLYRAPGWTMSDLLPPVVTPEISNVAKNRATETAQEPETLHDLHLEYHWHDQTPVSGLPYKVVTGGQTYTGTLDSQGKAHLTRLKLGKAQVTFGDPDVNRKINEATAKLQTALDGMVSETRARAKTMDAQLAQSGWLMEGVILTGAVFDGLYQSGKSGVETMVDLAGAQWHAEARAVELMTHGDMAQLKAALEHAAAQGSAALDALQRGFKTLQVLATDPRVYRLLADFPERYFQAMPLADKAHMLGSVAFNLLLALVTDGVGEAASALSASKQLAKARALIQDLAELIPKRRLFREAGTTTDSRVKEVGKKLAVRELEHRPRAIPETAETRPAATGSGLATDSESKICTNGCPISMVTGEELLRQEDASIEGPLPFTFIRTYRSSDLSDHGFGHGWRHNALQTLAIQGDDAVLVDAEGRHQAIHWPVTGEKTRKAAEGLVLYRESEMTVRLRQPGQPDRLFAPVPGTPGQWRLMALAKGPHRLMFAYDREERLVRVAGARNGLSLRYGDDGRLCELRRYRQGLEAHHRFLIRYSYDENGDLVAVEHPGGPGERYRYRSHLLSERQLRSGFRLFFEWDRADEKARCLRNWGEDGIYDYRFEWDPDNRASYATDSRGIRLGYRYNAQGQITAEIDGEGQAWVRYYDDRGRLSAKRDPLERTEQYHYDDRDRLTGVTNAIGQTTSLEYDEQDRPVALIESDGRSWRRQYDHWGQPLELRRPDGSVTRWQYDERGYLQAVLLPDGHQLTYHWDQWGRLQAEGDAFGHSTHYDYDNQGRIGAILDTEKRRTRYRYDDQDRPVCIERDDGSRIELVWDPEGRLLERTRQGADIGKLTETFTYNPAGQLTRYVDAAGHATAYDYEGLSQVKRRINPDGSVLEYEYDKERNLTALINERGERYELAYDGAERLIREMGFDGRVQEYGYNAAGELIQHRDGSRHTDFERDRLGRLLRKAANDGETAHFGYDDRGFLTQAVNDHRAVRFAYDPLGRCTAEWQDDQVTSHRYDGMGRRIATEWPDRTRIDYVYDRAGLLESVQMNGQTLTRFQYDAQGREIRRTQGQLLTDSDYDPQGRLSRQTIKHFEGGLRQQRDYGYDAAGRLSTLRDELKGETRYRYDARDRLLAVEGDLQERFAFDPAGTLLGPPDETLGNAPGPVRHGRLIMQGDRHFSYDDAGNLIEERWGANRSQERHYRYNAWNQLVAVEHNGQTVEFAYDALGRRTQKSDAFGTTTFLWDGDVLLNESRGNHQRRYLFEPGTFRPLAHLENGQTYYYHLDHLGTPRELSDYRGNLVWSVRYSAYGNVVREEVAEVRTPIRFQGQYFDEETGLHYNRFRYYHPGVGQFVNQDPIGLLGGCNLYRYVPNPIGWIDPWGLSAKKEDCQGVVFAGHGSIDENNHFVMPQGTELTVYSLPGSTITDDLGVAIEDWDPLEGVYKKTYKPGDKIPMLTLHPDDGQLTINPNSYQVKRDTNIDELLKPNMGGCRWAACTWKAGHPNSNMIFHVDGVYKQLGTKYFKQDGEEWIEI